MDTFPSYTPKYQAYKSPLKRTLVSDIDRHFIQRATDGINTEEESWNLVWTVVVSAGAVIEAFLEGKEGYQAFEWTPLDESTPLEFVCKQWMRSIIGPDLLEIQATFERFYTHE